MSEKDDLIEDGNCLVGGYKDAQRRTLDKLAAACKDGNIPEVQRLAAMTLTWWTPEAFDRAPAPSPDLLTVEELNGLREKLKFPGWSRTVGNIEQIRAVERLIATLDRFLTGQE